jgi:hypothetical protein
MGHLQRKMGQVPGKKQLLGWKMIVPSSCLPDNGTMLKAAFVVEDPNCQILLNHP